MAGTNLTTNAVQQRRARTSRREIALDLSVPDCFIPISYPTGELGLLVFRKAFNGSLYFG